MEVHNRVWAFKLQNSHMYNNVGPKIRRIIGSSAANGQTSYKLL